MTVVNNKIITSHVKSTSVKILMPLACIKDNYNNITCTQLGDGDHYYAAVIASSTLKAAYN